MLGALAPVLVTLLVGLITFAIMQVVKRGISLVDSLGTWGKRLILPLIAALVTWVGSTLGVPIACEPEVNCLTSLNAETVAVIAQVLAAAVVGHITFKLQKKPAS